MSHTFSKDTQLCVSLSARPSTIGTRFHNYLYEALGLDFVYKAFAPVDLAAAIQGMRGLPIRGAGLSMPLKEAVIPLLDSLDESARAIQAVNTIVNTDGHLRGYNTDMQAVATLLREAGVSASDHVAVIGSGGMAKACAAAVQSLGVTNAVVVARHVERGESLAKSYGFGFANRCDEADVVINATPVGMAGGEAASQLPVSEATVTGARLVMDCVAIPADTPLIRFAETAHVRTVRGTQIMTLQAVEQFELYTGVTPSAELVAAAATFSRKEN